MKQLTECYALLEGESEKEFLIFNANDAGVVIFMVRRGYKFFAYSDIKRILVRERVL